MRDEGLLEEEDTVELANLSSVRQWEHTVLCPTGDIVATLSLSFICSRQGEGNPRGRNKMVQSTGEVK
jgi:hypothetical protein